jgi:hypothetical protein
MTSSRRLWQYSSNDHLHIFIPHNIYRYTRSCLHVPHNCYHARCAPVGLSTIPNVPALTAQLLKYATSFAQPGSIFAPSFRRCLKTWCTYTHLVSFAGRRRSCGVPRRLAGLWPAVRATQADPRCLQGTTASSNTSTQALVVHSDVRSASEQRSERSGTTNVGAPASHTCGFTHLSISSLHSPSFFIASRSSPFPSTSGARRLRTNQKPSHLHSHPFHVLSLTLLSTFDLWSAMISTSRKDAAHVYPSYSVLASSRRYRHFSLFF